MKQQQLLQILLVAGSVWLGVAIGAIAEPVSSLEGKSKSVSRILRDSQATRNMPRLSELERPVTSAQRRVQSPAPATVPSPQIVQVTAVTVNPTDTGVEVILQTTQGEILQPVAITLGKTYIANIPNAVLALTERGEFRQDNPASGITRVAVTQATANSIRVTVTGEASIPTIELFDSPEEGLIFSVVSAAFHAATAATPNLTNATTS